jgi:prepilin-type N-terminal cleavage/methylation domain-containing protein
MRGGRCLPRLPNRRAALAKNLRGASSGFTLIEVVLALSIFALMGAILYGAFSLAQNAVVKSQKSAAESQKQRSASDLIGSYIHSAFPYRASPQDAAPFFDGEPDAVTFVSAYSHAMGGRGMAKIQISADEGTSGRANLRLEETTPVRLDNDSGVAGQSQGLVLEENVRQFRIDYLNPQTEDDIWEESWDARERRSLPRAVRFTYLDDQGTKISRTYPIMMMVLKP